MDRFNQVRESFMKKARPVDTPEERPSEYFGELTFDRSKMQKYLDAKLSMPCSSASRAASRWTGRRPTASRRA